ncbi:hypothetical protein AMET1_1335 [Methanonatronarchaeum thermophilum]|uniref:Uncharacterized protein n=1 Tax=Methanonatronarchaeum thermophilum TaxID=1927129 RepID=A0A1Y3GAH5_9EURY|nr:hypothetical protein [Methanonatronarchaeum thermophilum]OUJ18419.1 hypothetical protein AMET1_1335 [Methanonatronarchaeum thermophilum]
MNEKEIEILGRWSIELQENINKNKINTNQLKHQDIPLNNKKIDKKTNSKATP